MIYYFAYGSNLHHSQMKKRCPESFYIKKIVLNNFQLTFRNKGGWADIEKKDKKKVYGGLYTISNNDESRLDKYRQGKCADIQISRLFVWRIACHHGTPIYDTLT